MPHRLLTVLRNLAMDVYCRLTLPPLRWARQIRVSNSRLRFLGNCSVRGAIQLHDAVLELGAGSVVHRTANLGFSGKSAGFYTGRQVEIGAHADIGGAGVIRIGDYTTMAPFFVCAGDVSIGSNTLIAPRVFISSGSHIAKSRELIRNQDEQYVIAHGSAISKPVVIGDDCWLGVNAVICPGITLGTGCVVGAGSVVTKSFPAYTIVAGVPAKAIGTRQ